MENSISNLPTEVVTHIMKYLNLSDRKEASLVNKLWYEASLDPILKSDCVNILHPVRGHKQNQLTNIHVNSVGAVMAMERLLSTDVIALGNIRYLSLKGSDIDEVLCTRVLKRCNAIEHLDLSSCNSVFMSGNFMSRPQDQEELRDSLKNVKILNLSSIRYLSNTSFTNVVSVCGDLSRLILASVRFTFNENPYGREYNKAKDSTIITFSCLMKYVKDNANKIQALDLSRSGMNDESLKSLSEVVGLVLKEFIIVQCREVTDSGMRSLCLSQNQLELLDIGLCQGIGNGGIAAIANHLRYLKILRIPKCVLMTYAGIGRLGVMNMLREIEVSELCNLTSRCLIEAISSCRELKKLNVSYCTSLDDKFVVEITRTCRNISDINLVMLPITDVSIHAIIRNLKCLQSLKLTRCVKITDHALLGSGRRLCDVADDTCIELLNSPLQPNRSIDCLSSSQNCGDHSAISTREIMMKTLDSEDSSMSIEHLTHLRELHLGMCLQVADESLSNVVKFTSLQYLDLTGLISITDYSLQVISVHNPSLEHVSVSKCPKITDTGIKALVTNVKRLRKLEMTNLLKVTNTSMANIGNFCSRLVYLDVSCCTGITEEAVMETRVRVASLETVLMKYVGL